MKDSNFDCVDPRLTPEGMEKMRQHHRDCSEVLRKVYEEQQKAQKAEKERAEKVAKEFQEEFEKSEKERKEKERERYLHECGILRKVYEENQKNNPTSLNFL